MRLIYLFMHDRIRQSANRTRQMQHVNHRIANTNNNNNWHVQHCISKYTRLGQIYSFGAVRSKFIS